MAATGRLVDILNTVEIQCRERLRLSLDEMCRGYEAFLREILDLARQECLTYTNGMWTPDAELCEENGGEEHVFAGELYRADDSAFVDAPAVAVKSVEPLYPASCSDLGGPDASTPRPERAPEERLGAAVAIKMEGPEPGGASPLGCRSVEAEDEHVFSRPAPPEVGLPPIRVLASPAEPHPSPSPDLSSPGDARGPPFRCRVCGKKYLHKYNLTVHHRIHTGVRPHACSVCGKAFIASNTLKEHFARHFKEGRKKERPEEAIRPASAKPFVCDVCGKAYSLRVNLQLHRKSHLTEEEFPFKCIVCGKLFKRANHLGNHQRVHNLVP